MGNNQCNTISISSEGLGSSLLNLNPPAWSQNQPASEHTPSPEKATKVNKFHKLKPKVLKRLQENHAFILSLNPVDADPQFKDLPFLGPYQYENGGRYFGQYKEGTRLGRGIWIETNGDSTIGYFKNGQSEGLGLRVLSNGTYFLGSFNRGVPHGYGEIFYQDGSYYKGEFYEGKMRGQGLEHRVGQYTYIGNFWDFKWQGYGKLAYVDGKEYVGKFFGGKFHGDGTLRDPERPSQYEYSGEFFQGKKHGLGMVSNQEQNWRIVANFVHGDAQGILCTSIISESGS